MAIFAGNTTQDSFYGDNTTTTLTLSITGLTPSVPYSFEFGAARIGAGGDNRTAQYTVTGQNSGSGLLNAAENTSNTAKVNSIMPTSGGAITITMTKGTGNTNTSGWFYIGGMQMTVVPEPSAALLGALGALALLRRRR